MRSKAMGSSNTTTTTTMGKRKEIHHLASPFQKQQNDFLKGFEEETTTNQQQTKRFKKESFAFENLPNELLWKILSYLSCPDAFANAARVCHRWRQAIQKKWIDMPGRKGSLFCFGPQAPLSASWCALKNHVNCLDWIHEKQKNRDDFNAVAYCAGYKGHIQIIEWIKRVHGHLPMSAFYGAIDTGNIENAKRIHEEGAFSIDYHSFERATREGHLDLLIWLDQQQKNVLMNATTTPITSSSSSPPPNTDDKTQTFQLGSVLAVIAAKHGKFSIISWLYETKKMNVTPKMMIESCSQSNLELTKWIFKKRNAWFQFQKNAAAIKSCLHGHLRTFLWLIKKGAEIKPLYCIYASKNGHVRFLEWFARHDHIRSVFLMCWVKAIKHNRINVLEWLYHRSSQNTLANIQKITPFEISKKTNSRVTRWLIEKGFIPKVFLKGKTSIYDDDHDDDEEEQEEEDGVMDDDDDSSFGSLGSF